MNKNIDNYIRKATVTRVVDGDTFDAEIDLGFTANVKVRFRVRGVDTPEIYRPKSKAEHELGVKAKVRVEELILNNCVFIKSYKMGVYNRWEADVYLEDGRSLSEILKTEKLIK